MDKEEEFEDFKERLRDLDEDIRKKALAYATDFYASGKMTKAVALEKGITRAEIEERDL